MSKKGKEILGKKLSRKTVDKTTGIPNLEKESVSEFKISKRATIEPICGHRNGAEAEQRALRLNC